MMMIQSEVKELTLLFGVVFNFYHSITFLIFHVSTRLQDKLNKSLQALSDVFQLYYLLKCIYVKVMYSCIHMKARCRILQNSLNLVL